MQPEFTGRGPIPVSNPSVPFRAQSPVVLVVSTDHDLREASARALEREGYTVITAAHGGHAVLACLRAGHVDVLAADLSMDDLSGPALAARLRRFCPGMSTVYFGQSGTAECAGILVRPFTRDDLLAAIAASIASAISAF
jgi:CheY-like chemotaxis protein